MKKNPGAKLKFALILTFGLLLSACGGSSSGGGITDESTADGGSIDEDTVDGGSTDEDTADGGSTDEDTADGGSTDEDTADGGSTDEDTVDGGSTDEDTVDGGSTDEDTADGGSTDEDTADGGSTDEDTADEGSTDEDTVDGGSTDEDTVDEGSTDESASVSPNILLIISDDQGIDSSSQYFVSDDLPTTPVIDALAADGIVFDNAWATPGCTTTRCSIITGRYGAHTGVTAIGDILPSSETTIQKYLSDAPETADYRSAIVGKWHLGGRSPDADQPGEFGVSYYAGILEGSLDDYEDWTLTEQGQVSNSTVYSTTKMTDLAMSWIDDQGANPWFMWLAYNAPHSPYHLPPAALHSSGLSGSAADIDSNPRPYYLAAIEAMDTEIGRLLASLPTEVRENTVVMFIGDNGTPSPVRDQAAFANNTKGSLTEGGLRVPMVVSGSGVTRAGEREPALINITDFFATIADIGGAGIEDLNDSVSFKSLLSESDVAHRNYIYSDFDNGRNAGFAIRDNRYKYVEFEDGTEELYDLQLDSTESNNLIGSDDTFDAIADRLRAESDLIRN